MKYVESYWIEEMPNGVFHLLINTSERWVYFQIADKYTINIWRDESELWDATDIELKVKEFLPKIEGVFVASSYQEKDQIGVYYIPHLRENLKNRKYIEQKRFNPK